jgi:hypothetical protein
MFPPRHGSPSSQRSESMSRAICMYEQEADRVAEQVMCMPDPVIQRQVVSPLQPDSTLAMEPEPPTRPEPLRLTSPRLLRPGEHTLPRCWSRENRGSTPACRFSAVFSKPRRQQGAWSVAPQTDWRYSRYMFSGLSDRPCMWIRLSCARSKSNSTIDEHTPNFKALVQTSRGRLNTLNAIMQNLDPVRGIICEPTDTERCSSEDGNR